MADFDFVFQDSDDNAFIDWDCVWRSWTWRVFKTISRVMALKYRAHPMPLKYKVHAIGKKTSVVEKL